MDFKPRNRGDWVMGISLAVSVLAGLIAPLFGANPMGIAVPFLLAAIIAMSIIAQRRKSEDASH